MCSTHPRVIKKARENLEAILATVTTDVADNDILAAKALKRHAADEVTTFDECPASDRFLKVFESPTPAKNADQFRRHLEWAISELRR